MKSRTELQLEKSKISICYSDNLVLLGSCFSENIGDKFTQIKYHTTVNPLGIIYHPIPLHKGIIEAIHAKKISKQDLTLNVDGLYTTWDIHSRLSTIDAEETVIKMNEGISQLNRAVQNANYLILTYGTSYCYYHNKKGAVANCHKFPSRNFEKILSMPSELRNSFDLMYTELKKLNPNLKVLLTVSPVRHIKDGIVENNRSKAHLLTAVHDICDKHQDCTYLPSYELLIDDLRDYRYYAEDMVHPTAVAIDYIWKKIGEYILDTKEANLRAEISKIVIAASHRPININSEQHIKFLATQAKAIDKLAESYPNLDFGAEMKVFRD